MTRRAVTMSATNVLTFEKHENTSVSESPDNYWVTLCAYRQKREYYLCIQLTTLRAHVGNNTHVLEKR